MKHVIEK